jgi:hypothetical protein
MLHFRDIHKGDRVFEAEFGVCVEIEVMTEPKLHKDKDTWTFTGRINDRKIEYMMLESHQAYAPRLSRTPDYYHVRYLDGTKEG